MQTIFRPAEKKQVCGEKIKSRMKQLFIILLSFAENTQTGESYY
jgi:hypothetical protein